MEVISTSQLLKRFGDVTAVNNLSLNVSQGDIYGFAGLNGAGKTTLIRMLLGMIKANSGHIRLFDQPVIPGFKLWNDVGYLVETPYAYPNLTVKENLQVYFRLRQLEKRQLIDEIIEKLQLTAYTNKKAKNLSLGNLQRLGLAKALLHKPRLLILDEPINGLDPAGIVETRELLNDLVANDSTIFLSSHILGEISKVCNKIGIIHRGLLIKELTVTELDKQLIKKVVVITQNNAGAIIHLKNKGYTVSTNEGTLEIPDERAIAHPEIISRLLSETGYPPIHISVFKEDLEMYFFRIIESANQ